MKTEKIEEDLKDAIKWAIKSSEGYFKVDELIEIISSKESVAEKIKLLNTHRQETETQKRVGGRIRYILYTLLSELNADSRIIDLAVRWAQGGEKDDEEMEAAVSEAIFAHNSVREGKTQAMAKDILHNYSELSNPAQRPSSKTMEAYSLAMVTMEQAKMERKLQFEIFDLGIAAYLEYMKR